ncbi:MAG: PIG-L family deacetylase [Ignisphaera sp.]
MAEVAKYHDLDFNKIRRVLIVSPHPDDEVLGCGGTIKELNNMGKEVEVLFLTHGEKFVDPERRKAEAIRVKEELGYEKAEFWDFPDGELKQYKKEIKNRLKSYILSRELDLVFSTAPYDFHIDHITVGEICTELHLELYPKRFAFYSNYSHIIGNLNFDVSEHIGNLKKCLELYSLSLNQLSGMEDFFFSRRLFNGIIFRLMGRYVESFLVLKEDWDVENVVEYIMGDYFKPDCAFYSYNQVKHVHHIIGYAKYLESEIQKKGAELYELQEKYSKLITYVHLLERELSSIKTSKFYKMMIKYNKLKDTIIPQGSLLRRFYDRMMGNEG